MRGSIGHLTVKKMPSQLSPQTGGAFETFEGLTGTILSDDDVVHEPFYEECVTPVKIRRFSFDDDTSGSSCHYAGGVKSQISDQCPRDEKSVQAPLKSILVGTQKLQRQNAK